MDLYRQRSQNNELIGKNAAGGEVWAVRANWFFEPGWQSLEVSHGNKIRESGATIQHLKVQLNNYGGGAVPYYNSVLQRAQPSVLHPMAMGTWVGGDDTKLVRCVSDPR